MELAGDGGSPRAYEVAGQLIKSVADTTDKLIDLQKKLKDVQEDNTKIANNVTNVLSRKSAFTNNNATLEEMTFGQQLVYFIVLFIIIYFVMFIGSIFFNDSIVRIFPGVKKVNNKPVKINELLGNNPIEIADCIYGIYLPQEEILKRYKYSWFARLSTDQILKSDLNISKYMIASY